jgi:hypothetical protein
MKGKQVMKNRSIIFVAILFIFALLCAAAAPKAFGVVPAPDGGYPGFNTAEGQNALKSLSSGQANTAVGWFSLFSNAEGNFNTATGVGALLLNTADNNTAFGAAALLFNTTGEDNTAIGVATLLNNTTGFQNTAVGGTALNNNITGARNSALGYGALRSNEDSDNVAIGWLALANNTAGNSNTATGVQALTSNNIGGGNTANGFQALLSNTIGSGNTANGGQALFNNTDGDRNTAIGEQALVFNTTGSENTAIGPFALTNITTGSSNIALGFSAGVNLTGDDNIDIGNEGVAAESGTIRIGTAGTHTATFIAGITGVPVTGTTVVADGSGQLGVAPSSQRFKDKIKPMDEASEAILALKPVTFRYKHELDPKSIPQFGLVAEEVAKVNPDLVVRDENGEIYTVRYEAVNAMLLNEFLKEHRKVETLEAALDVVNERLNQQDARIQKVSAQVEISKTAPRVVRNNP